MSNLSGQETKNRFIPSLWWLRGACFWLVVASLLGLTKSLPLAAMLWQDGDLMSLPLGRLFLAAKGAFIYGWACSALVAVAMGIFPGVSSFSPGWHKLIWATWQAGLVLGTASILAGQGTGIPSLPFAPFASAVIFLAFGAFVLLLAARGYSRHDHLSGFALFAVLSAFCVMLTGFVTLTATGSSGTVGMMLVAALRTIIPFGAVVVCLSAFLIYSEGGNVIVKKIGLLILGLAALIAIPCSGISNLISWPVPWTMVVWGIASSFSSICVLFVVCLLCLYCTVKEPRAASSERFRFFFRNVGLAVLTAWLVWKYLNPLTSYGTEDGQFSLVQWYSNDIFILLTIGLVGIPVFASRMARYVPWRAVVSLVASLFPLLTCMAAVYSHYTIHREGIGRAVEMMSRWVAFISAAEAVSWLALLVVGLIVIFGLSGLSDSYAPRRNRVYRAKPGIAVMALVLVALPVAAILYQAGRLDGIVRRVVPFDSLRPGSDAEGAAIYASEGCGLCHSQMIRRLISGDDLQRIIDAGGQGDTPYRVSEPQDYDCAMREGIAHAGYTRIGPDLFNLAARVETGVTYTDSSGKPRRVATPREWLLLHLYNPRDPVWGKPWSVCPSMAFLFERQAAGPQGPSPEALAVVTDDGKQIVPTERALRLAAYLTTLKRTSSPPQRNSDMDYVNRRWTHVASEYVNRMPRIDDSPIREAATAAAFERGRQVFLARCAICHGADGKGDAQNYPPLDGSEWIALKDASILAGIVRNGLSGPIEVKGRAWDSTMLPPGVTGPHELGPLMIYLQRTFGGKPAFHVTPEEAAVLWKGAEPSGD